MAFTPLGVYTFLHANQIDKLYNTPMTAAQIKANFDVQGAEVKAALNAVVAILNSTVSLSSGSENIGSASVSGVSGSTIYAQIVALKALIDGKQPLEATLTALAAFSTNGFLVQTAADTFVGRSITGTSNRVVVTNGDGVSANPTLDIGTDVVTLTGSQTQTNKTLTSPTINSPTVTSPTESTTLSAITVDGTVIGEWAVATMAASCAVYDVVYMSSSGYNKAKADADATLPSVGMCIETGTGARKVLKKGYVKNNAWAWTAGQLLYVSTATAGAITSTLPTTLGNRVQIIGYAESATIIYFNPDYTFAQV